MSDVDPSSDPNQIDGFAELQFAFRTLKRIRKEKLRAFPFLKQSTDYALLLYIGYEQVRGRRTNMNSILTSGIGTPSTLIRRMSELEELSVVRKFRSGSDKRNTYYELTEMPLVRVRGFLAYVATLLEERAGQLRSTQLDRASNDLRDLN